MPLRVGLGIIRASGFTEDGIGLRSKNVLKHLRWSRPVLKFHYRWQSKFKVAVPLRCNQFGLDDL